MTLTLPDTLQPPLTRRAAALGVSLDEAAAHALLVGLKVIEAGAKGGRTRAARMTPDERRDAARAARACHRRR